MVTKIPQISQAESFSGLEKYGDFCIECFSPGKNKFKCK